MSITGRPTLDAPFSLFCTHPLIKAPARSSLLPLAASFQVPGGTAGVVIVSLLVMIFTIAYFIISVMDGSPAVIVGVKYYYLKVRSGIRVELDRGALLSS